MQFWNVQCNIASSKFAVNGGAPPPQLPGPSSFRFIYQPFGVKIRTIADCIIYTFNIHQ